MTQRGASLGTLTLGDLTDAPLPNGETRRPDAVSRIIAHLDALPFGQNAGSATVIARVIGLAPRTFHNYALHPALTPYRFTPYIRRVVWANRATIAALKKGAQASRSTSK